MTNACEIRHSSFVNSSFSPLLGLDNRPAAVLAAVWADDVRRLRRAAFGARLELLSFEGVVRATHACAGVGLFAFWYGHDCTCRSGSPDPAILGLFASFGESTSVRPAVEVRQGRDFCSASCVLRAEKLDFVGVELPKLTVIDFHSELVVVAGRLNGAGRNLGALQIELPGCNLDSVTYFVHSNSSRLTKR
jgi:hypothetical protein